MTLTLEALVHAHLVALVRRAAVEQSMVLPVTAVVEHAVGVMRRRVRARRSVRGRRVRVGLEERPTVIRGRAVAVMRVSGVRGMVVVEELAAGIEPVETIGHHRARERGRLRPRACWCGPLGVEE